MKDKDTIKQRVLKILLDSKPHHASEFTLITHRFSAVFERLRKEDGYDIKTLPLDGHNKAAWYQLVLVPAAA